MAEYNKQQDTSALEACQAQAEEYLNGWKRAQADLINYKKEENKRIQELLKFGNERILLEMIDALDGLETALQHAPPNTDLKWLQGMKQVVAQLRDNLKKHNIERIQSIGKPFDPHLHEAVSEVESHPDESGKVIEELRPGYKLYDKVIRPARVIISN